MKQLRAAGGAFEASRQAFVARMLRRRRIEADIRSGLRFARCAITRNFFACAAMTFPNSFGPIGMGVHPTFSKSFRCIFVEEGEHVGADAVHNGNGQTGRSADANPAADLVAIDSRLR